MRRALSWGVFILVLLGGYVLAGPTALGGPASYVIVDGQSMEPTYATGDLLVARERDRYEVGEVIVYDAAVDGQFEVVHRIVEPTDGGFVTQGDNVPDVDPWIAQDDRIHGRVLLHIPRGGHAVHWLRQPPVVFALVLGLGTFELLKQRERKQHTAVDEVDVEEVNQA
jgi:signal peptidase I